MEVHVGDYLGALCDVFRYVRIATRRIEAVLKKNSYTLLGAYWSRHIRSYE